MEPFEPSCGTESLLLLDLCETCERDRAAWPKEKGGEDRPEDGCIITATFGMNGRHPLVMWKNRQVYCLKYVEEGQEIPEEDTQTLRLFG